jgi:hypothetical protein
MPKLKAAWKKSKFEDIAGFKIDDNVFVLNCSNKPYGFYEVPLPVIRLTKND